MDWKDVGGAVLKAAPMLGSIIGGPVGLAVGAAAKIAADALGVDATPDAVSQAIQNDPAAALKLREAEMTHAERLQELANVARQQEIDAALAVRQAEIDELKANLADVQDARAHSAADKNVFRLGGVVLLIFLVIIAIVLYGAGQMLTGKLAGTSPDLLATVTGLVGTIIGMVGNNALQVINFYFGSSKGSADKTNALALAVSGIRRP